MDFLGKRSMVKESASLEEKWMVGRSWWPHSTC